MKDQSRKYPANRRILMRKILLALVAAVVLFSQSSAADGILCKEVPLATDVDNAEAIFVGHVTQVGIETTFSVSRILKGEIKTPVRVRSVETNFKVGEEWLIFARKDVTNPRGLVTTLCDRSRRFADPQADFQRELDDIVQHLRQRQNK
jgi:hypothetical protein